MKILKYLLYVILALVVIVIILGFFGPKTYQLERSVVIARTPDVVWPHISSLRRTNEWSPFLKMDTTMVLEYKGADGEVGSSSSWVSKNAGKGEQTIVAIEPMKSSDVKLKFFTPFGEMESNGYLRLEPDPAPPRPMAKSDAGPEGTNSLSLACGDPAHRAAFRPAPHSRYALPK